MKINETHPKEKGFVLWGHCQNILDDPRMKDINWSNYTTIHSDSHYEFEFIECLRDNFLFQHISDFT